MNWRNWIKQLRGESTRSDYRLVVTQRTVRNRRRGVRQRTHGMDLTVGTRRISQSAGRGVPTVRTLFLGRARETPLWQKRGWTQRGYMWKGTYRVGKRSWQGSAETIGERYKFYIQEPPPVLLTGAHSRCYVPKGDKGYFVHFSPTQPTSLSAGIGGIEHQLAQALAV